MADIDEEPIGYPEVVNPVTQACFNEIQARLAENQDPDFYLGNLIIDIYNHLLRMSCLELDDEENQLCWYCGNVYRILNDDQRCTPDIKHAIVLFDRCPEIDITITDTGYSSTYDSIFGDMTDDELAENIDAIEDYILEYINSIYDCPNPMVQLVQYIVDISTIITTPGFFTDEEHVWFNELICSAFQSHPVTEPVMDSIRTIVEDFMG